MRTSDETDGKTERAFRCSLRKSSIKCEQSILKWSLSTANDFERKTRMAWTQVTGYSCQVVIATKSIKMEEIK